MLDMNRHDVDIMQEVKVYCTANLSQHNQLTESVLETSKEDCSNNVCCYKAEIVAI